MKKSALLLFLYLSVSTYAFSYEFDESATWQTIYSFSENEYKKELLETVFVTPDFSMEDFFRINFESIFNCKTTEEENILMLLMERLSQLNTFYEADKFYSIVESSRGIKTRCTAVEALGRVGAQAYGSKLMKLLDNANTKAYYYHTNGYTKEAEENAKLASSIIISLENLKFIDSYESVFRASRSAYPEKSTVYKKAVMAMESFTDNPTEILKSLSDREPGGNERSFILSLEMSSKASEAEKVNLASYILSQSVIKELPEHEHYFDACGIIRDSSIKCDITNELETILYSDKYSIELRTAAIHAMANCNGSTSLFINFMQKQNQLFRIGKIDFNNRLLVIEVINALGDIGDESALEELVLTKKAGWSDSIIQAADKAISKITGNY